MAMHSRIVLEVTKQIVNLRMLYDKNASQRM